MNKLSRRTMLRGALGTAACLPLLEATLARRAAAEPLLAPKRLVVLFTPHGAVRENWTPTGSEHDFELSPILEPLSKHKNDLTIVDGVDVRSAAKDKGNGHARGMAHMLTAEKMIPQSKFYNGFGDIGYAGGPSFDQVIAQQIGDATKFPSLEFGVESAGGYAKPPIRVMNYSAAEEPIAAEGDPQKMLDRVFGDFMLEPEALTTRRAQRDAVLEFASKEYDHIAPKLVSSDAARIQGHLAHLADIRDSIYAGANAACALPTLGPHQGYRQTAEQQIKLLAMALACDLTRVASLQFSNGSCAINYSWAGADKNLHPLTHDTWDGQVKGVLTNVGIWHAEQVAMLIEELKQLEDVDGSSVFDNTVIFWTTEVAEGKNHSFTSVPYVLAGSCGGALETGRWVQYQNEKHGNLLRTLMEAMEVDHAGFGDPAYTTGPIADLLT